MESWRFSSRDPTLERLNMPSSEEEMQLLASGKSSDLRTIFFPVSEGKLMQAVRNSMFLSFFLISTFLIILALNDNLS